MIYAMLFNLEKTVLDSAYWCLKILFLDCSDRLWTSAAISARMLEETKK